MDIETLRVRIEAETSQFKAAIAQLQNELQGLQKAADMGGISKKTYKNFRSLYSGFASEVKRLKKDLEKSYSDITYGLPKGSALADKIYTDSTGIDYKQASLELEQQAQLLAKIYEQYNLLSPFQIAEGSIKRQVVSDTITQTQEMQKQLQLADGTYMSIEQIKKAIDYASGSIHKTVKDIKEIPGHTEKINKSVGKLQSRLKNILLYRVIRALISMITTAIKDAFDLLVRFDKEFNNNSLGYNKTISDLTSAFKKLGASITAALGEILVAFGPVLTYVVNGLTKIANMLSAIFAALNGKYTYTVANPNYWQDYAANLDDSNKSAKELKKTLASFDELDILNKNSSDSSSVTGINPDDMYVVKELPDWLKKVSDFSNKLKDIFGENWLSNLLLGLGAVKLLSTALSGLRTITDLVRNAFGKKNTALETQTSLEGLALVPVLALAAGYALLHDKIAELVKKMKEGLDGAMQDAKDWWEQKKQQTADGWATVGALAASAWAALTEGLKGFFEGWNTDTETNLETGRLTWATKLAAILAIAAAFCLNISEKFGTLMENIGKNIGEGWTNITTNFSTGMEKVGTKISEWGTSLAGWFGDLWNTIGTTITNGVNKSIDKINGLVSAYKKAKAEDYANQVSAWQNKVAAARALGITTAIAFVYTAFRKISLPSIGSLVPGFANGGVLTAPTLGLMGEYPGARSNPEIVTPENKMREVFSEGNTEMLIELKKNNALLAELLNKDTSITIGDDTISAAAARGNRNYAKRTGRSQFAV